MYSGAQTIAMRIGFLCTQNPHDRNSFSGTLFYAWRGLQGLRARGEIEELRLLGRHPRPGLEMQIARLRRRIRGGPFLPPRFDRRGDLGEGLDAIVALVASDLIDRLPLRAPTVLVTDATPGFRREFYRSKLPPEAEEREGRVIGRAARVVYSSAFMRDLAIRDYGPDVAARSTVIPFGVNLDDLPGEASERGTGGPLELLFIGKDWERKGGRIALDTLHVLRERGIPARLTIVGCNPAEAAGDADVTIHPYLDKNRPADAAIFNGLLRQAHVFVLPTRADCTPMVIAEANAYSVPVLVTDTGGIGTLVEPGRNGFMMAMEAGGADYADAVLRMTSDPDAYATLRRDSFAQYRDRLNWDAWAQSMLACLRETLATSSHQPGVGE